MVQMHFSKNAFVLPNFSVTNYWESTGTLAKIDWRSHYFMKTCWGQG